MSRRSELNAVSRFADVDALSGELFDQVVPHHRGADANPSKIEDQRGSEPTASHGRNAVSAVSRAISKWIIRAHLRDEPHLGNGRNNSASGTYGWGPSDHLHRRNVILKRSKHGGLNTYLALPGVQMLESKPQAVDEEAMMAVIREIMAAQRRETSRTVFPELPQVDSPRKQEFLAFKGVFVPQVVAAAQLHLSRLGGLREIFPFPRPRKRGARKPA